MTSIKNYISDLLCRHDCVIVPGLGGFVANYKPAVIVNERNLFCPPSKEIGFNRSLSHNDGLLANHVCQRENLPYNDSIELINDFVSSLKVEIHNGETVRFQGVGTFREDALGSMQFTPDEQNQLLPGAFGLEEFHFEPLHDAATRKHEEPVRRFLRSRTPRYWTSVAAMIAGLFLFTPELKMPNHQQVDTGNIISNVVQSENKSDASSDLNITNHIQYQNKPGETPGTSANDNDKDAAAKVKTPFHLISASFKYESPAKTALRQLQDEGFSDARVLHSGNGRYRVSMYSFSEREQAVEKLYALRETDRFQNVWLLSVCP